MTKKTTKTRRWGGGKPLATAVNVVAILLLLAMVVPFVIYSVPQVVGADQTYVVLTGSMEPAISPGDVVVVSKVNPETVAVGDVIVYTRSGQDVPTTHRVLEVTETEQGQLAFRTKGDANEDPDSRLVPASNLIGAVTLTLPFIGHVIAFVNSPEGFIAMVLLPFGLLILNEVWGMYRVWRGDSDDAPANDTEDAPTADAVATATVAPTVTAATTLATTGNGEGGLTLSRDSLLVALGVAVLLTLYSGLNLWFIYARVLPIQQLITFSMMVFVASIGLLLVLAQYWAGLPAADESDDTAPEVDDPENKPSATDGGVDDVESEGSAADPDGDATDVESGSEASGDAERHTETGTEPDDPSADGPVTDRGAGDE
ncbi:signal peptidase I [Haloarchaeobius sp. DT45]|uniref:signal peptidase I n=1 Tax=Haloarchaeobius sp. DT45 TaxID=3446116 RepID=UPI003F6C5B63